MQNKYSKKEMLVIVCKPSPYTSNRPPCRSAQSYQHLLNPFPPSVPVGSGPYPLLLRPLGQGPSSSHCPKSFPLRLILPVATELIYNEARLSLSPA